MRVALLALGLLLVGTPALAAGPGLGRLVLRASDVPAGFEAVPEDTGPLSNEHEWRDAPQMKPILQRAGRVTGHGSRFERRSDSVSSRVDLFRTSAGSRILLGYFRGEMRKSGIRGLRSSRIALGDEGSVYFDPKKTILTIVVWRSGRLFSAVAAAGVPRERVLALARLQQRRIAAFG
jgi:hypothetical protein